MPHHFVPESFCVPLSYQTGPFYLTTLDEKVAEVDYAAVMSSQQSLTSIFGPHSTWPQKDMTLQQSMVSLKVHENEFKSRQAFAYSVFNHSQSVCLGSVYIDPSRLADYDCEVYFWVRDDCLILDLQLYSTVMTWLCDDWPFSRVVYPGRSLSWDSYLDLLSNANETVPATIPKEAR